MFFERAVTKLVPSELGVIIGEEGTSAGGSKLIFGKDVRIDI